MGIPTLMAGARSRAHATVAVLPMQRAVPCRRTHAAMFPPNIRMRGAPWRVQEGSPARFGLKMVDTVLFTGGEPTTWLFTAKVRARRVRAAHASGGMDGCPQQQPGSARPRAAEAGAR